MHNKNGRCIARGVAIGLMGGLAGSWMMNQFWAVQSKLQQEDPQEKKDRGVDNAPAKVAEAVSRPLLRRQLSRSEKKTGGSIVHYAFGAAMGALYGGLCEAVPAANAGFGSAYGTALWATADEIMVPALKLGPPPQEASAEKHLSGFGAHVIFGLTTEAVRQLLRNVH